MTNEAEIVSAPGAIEQIEQMARKPFALPSIAQIAAVPDGYRLESLEHMSHAPMRAKGSTTLHDVDSFIAMCQRFGGESDSLIYVAADYASQNISATAVFNDHHELAHANDRGTGWRDHRAIFKPRFTQEWKRWMAKNGEDMNQAAFAFFLEANLPEIVSPAGGEVLEFVTNLQDTRQVTYGRAVNLQSGLVQIEFKEKGDEGQTGRLELFKELQLALRPFEGGTPYSIKALLRYRINRNSGEISFWFDIQRPERVLEDACREAVEKIRTDSGLPVVFGTPD